MNMMIDLQGLALVVEVVVTRIVIVLIKKSLSKQIIEEVTTFVKVGIVKLILCVNN